MSNYTALYRKFRPQTFEEVKGQEHVVTCLRNQVIHNRIGHAYLFCGTRGTGKTTLAKILAKAINCDHPVNGSPCGTCPSCQAIINGSSLCVQEIDAASNNGVENIRQIREEVAYLPTDGKYKVYIIDEVHMLSTGAFNALLKTLEEPPSYVVFILATTEAHKIPVTITSRCQQFGFNRLSTLQIEEQLKNCLRMEGAQAEDQALAYIARKADGAMRDALSLLDECMAFYMNEVLTYDKVLQVLGAMDTEVFRNLLLAITGQDVVASMSVIDRLVREGADIPQFTQDFSWYLRNLMLLKSSDGIEQVLDLSVETQTQMLEDAKVVRMDTLMRFIRIFSDLSSQLKHATQKRITLELAVIRTCRPQMETDAQSQMDRIRALENAVFHGTAPLVQTLYTVPEQTSPFVPTGAPSGIPFGRPIPEPISPGIPPVPDTELRQVQNPIPMELIPVKDRWERIVEDLSGLFRQVIRKSSYLAWDTNRGTLAVVFTDFLGERYLGDPRTTKMLETAILRHTGLQQPMCFYFSHNFKFAAYPPRNQYLQGKTKT